MAHEIHKVSVRKALTPRREPYWGAPIARGKFLGFRKIDDETGTWIARIRTEEGRQTYASLGHVADTFDFDAAREAAEAWFKNRDAGIAAKVGTVEEACKAYVEDRRREKGEATAQDAKMRFERTVYGKPLGARPLDKLRTRDLKTWRDGIALAPASSNRTLISLKAALNLAVSDRRVPAAAAQEWRDVKPIKNAGRRRDLFLDLAQRRALLGASEGAARTLMEGVMLTGARAGELTGALRSQFDSRTGSMKFVGKTGARTVPLSPAALKLFKKLARKKLPSDRLFVRDDGEPWAHSDWDELVRDAAGKADLPQGVCLYTLRHSFITTALTAGMSTLDVARLAGTSLTMIERHYGHLVASAARERLAKVQMI